MQGCYFWGKFCMLASDAIVNTPDIDLSHIMVLKNQDGKEYYAVSKEEFEEMYRNANA